MGNKELLCELEDLSLLLATCEGCSGSERCHNCKYRVLARTRKAVAMASGCLKRQDQKAAALEQELATTKREREYFRSRAVFFGELAKATTDGVISVEGFKAFRGTMRITPKAAVPAFELTGDWLYKPETGCWYGKGSSFAEDICTIVEVYA